MNGPSPTSHAHTLKQVSVIGTSVIVTAALFGCVKPLFPEDQPRTQFETYDRLRNRDVPLQEPDVFGRPQPALRARLTPPQ